MRVCPIGGIATLNELQVIAVALDLACEYVSMIIQSETPDFRVRTSRAVFEANKQFSRDGANPREDVLRAHLQDALSEICEALQFLTPRDHKRAAFGKPRRQT